MFMNIGVYVQAVKYMITVIKFNLRWNYTWSRRFEYTK